MASKLPRLKSRINYFFSKIPFSSSLVTCVTNLWPLCHSLVSNPELDKVLDLLFHSPNFYVVEFIECCIAFNQCNKPIMHCFF